MGCFLGCFKGSKDRKRSRKWKKSSPEDKSSHEKENCVLFCPSSSPKVVISETELTTDDQIPKLRENQEQGTVANFRKKVTFNLNVTTFESVPVQEDSIDFRENDAVEIEVKEDEKNDEKQEESTGALKSVAYPQNHRYQNYESSDDEGLDEDGGNSDEDEIDSDEGNDIGIYGDEEESYDSYFSLPMESQRLNLQEVSSHKPDSGYAKDMELVSIAKGNVRDRSRYIHSVLNPVENLSHWKEVKVRPVSLKNPSKENINIDNETRALISPELTIKSQELHTPISSKTNPDNYASQEINVEASLSNWFVSPDNSRLDPQKSNSFLSNSTVSLEERPILGALTMEDIKQSSRTSSPRKSPSRSPEEIPIVGTVGGYWSSKSKEDSASSWSSGSEKRGIPNTTSKYREDKRVNWYCTPFETRLERALTIEATGTCSNVESTA